MKKLFQAQNNKIIYDSRLFQLKEEKKILIIYEYQKHLIQPYLDLQL